MDLLSLLPATCNHFIWILTTKYQHAIYLYLLTSNLGASRTSVRISVNGGMDLCDLYHVGLTLICLCRLAVNQTGTINIISVPFWWSVLLVSICTTRRSDQNIKYV